MSELINWFAEPLAFPFMQNALLTALIVSITCGLLSCYLVLKGWSLMGDAVSHAVLPGIVLAFVFGIPLQIGAFASGLLCSVGVGYLKNNRQNKRTGFQSVLYASAIPPSVPHKMNYLV